MMTQSVNTPLIQVYYLTISLKYTILEQYSSDTVHCRPVQTTVRFGL